MFFRRFQPFGHFRRITNPRTPITPGYGNCPAGNHLTRGWPIPLDSVEEDGQFMVHAAVPVVDPEDLEIAVADGALTIEDCSNMGTEHKNGKYPIRERRFGGFRRSLRLPEWADVDKAEPRYCNGVLSLGLPKLAGRDVKRLEVTVEEPAGELPEREAWPRSRVAHASGEHHGRFPDRYFARPALLVCDGTR